MKCGPSCIFNIDFLYMFPMLLTVSGKAEVSSVVYKVGECMQELIKLWKEYEASQAEKNSESSSSGPTLEIRIPAEHVTATNRQVKIRIMLIGHRLTTLFLIGSMFI